MRTLGLLVLLYTLTYVAISEVSAAPGGVGGDNQAKSLTSANTNVQKNAAFNLGSRIAESLSIGSWFFVGTITNVDKAKKDSEAQVDSASSPTKVSINVEEHLWGKDRKQAEVQVDYITKPLAPRSSGPWEAWEGVDLQVGKRLIVALWDDTPNRPVYRGTPVDAAIVVSNEALFPTIKNILSYHARQTSSPENILQAPSLLDGNTDYVEAGYISTWLWRNINPDNLDNEVIALGRLFGKEDFPEIGQAIVRIALMTRLMNDGYQLSNTTRYQTIKSVVNMSGSDNVKLAFHALTILLRLSESGQLDIEPFLNESLRDKIIRNYQKIAPTGSNIHFESQIGLKKN